MRATIGEVAALVEGEVIGDANLELTGVSSLTEAEPGDISFLANPRYASLVADTQASAVIVEEHLPAAEVAQVVVANPDWAFARVVARYGPQPQPMPPGIHPTAVIGDGVELGDEVAIGAYTVIGDGAAIGNGCVLHPHVFVGAETRLGGGCVIYPHVTIREQCRLGERVIVHSGAVIGSDGFGYASVQGVHHKIPQVGTAEIGDDVEIGANTTIDRARFGKTVIGQGTKIDNLVQVAHNVEIGAHCIVVAQVGIAGSTRIGNHVAIGGQAGITGHLEIGDLSRVAARSGVSKNLPAKAVVMGAPAMDMKAFRQQEVAVRRLQRTQATVKDLEARLERLERERSGGDEG